MSEHDEWNQTQRAHAAAHLCDLASAALRSVGADKGFSLLAYAHDLMTEYGPDDFYREGLLESGVSFDDVEIAVAAILDGKHPPDSLPGKVERYRGKAEREAAHREGYRARTCEGEAHALAHVLTLLGCKVSP